MKRTKRTRHAVVAVAAVAMAMSLTGCSDEAKAEIACERADDLKDGVADISREVRLGDLDDAKEDARELRRDFDRLEARVGDASKENQSTIKPLLQPADDAIAALEAASTIEEMSAALDQGRAKIEALASGVDSALKCED